MTALLILVSVRPARAISYRTLIAPTAEAANDAFGYPVSSAGDWNGDGYGDVIVGAPGNDVGGSKAGRAYVYYGGPEADTVADLTLTGEAEGDEFGVSVAMAGDVNGDGYPDVIVGTHRNDAGGTNSGRAYLFFGGPGADAVADLTLTGEAADDEFGISVSGGGDANGDGFADVIVGAHGNDAGGTDAGRAYVYFGGPGADNLPDMTLTGGVAGEEFGISVSGAGDVNGDGFADFIVGADNPFFLGHAYVYFGGVTPDTIADLTLIGETADDRFGHSVSGAGDVNGDGYADVVVGAYGNDAGGADAGRAYLYHGGPAADTVADLTLTGMVANDWFGISVSDVGDVNGDGYVDIMVGADSGAGGGGGAGRAHVYLGGPGADAEADIILTGEAVGDRFGVSVAGAGDVNGDGLADVIVGASSSDASGPVAGRAYVVLVYSYEVLTPNGGEMWVAGEPATVRWLGRDVADIALSTDGGLTYTTVASQVGGLAENEWTITVPSSATDFAKIRVFMSGIMAQRSTSDESDRVFRIVRPHSPPAAASRLMLTPTGDAASDWLGFSVSGAGDVNGDGFADLIIGAPGSDAGGTDEGQAYVYYGGPGADVVPDLTLNGEAAGDLFGYSVSGAGDVNGDGYADVIVGAWGNDVAGASAGRAYVYYGGPGADTLADLTLTGATAGDNFGASVSGAGDVNGDGFADVIVGAYGSDGGGVDTGRAYVFYGGPLADVVADLALVGEAAGDSFGRSVSEAGDVNGDGFADVVVGADRSDVGGTNAGRAYVFHGGPGADAVPDLTMTGQGPDDEFGFSVSGAGDFNGDGYADVIVGARLNDARGTDTGRAYVYYGGPGADVLADLTFTGESAGDIFGRSVSGAGDVNGDGFPDIIVGATGARDAGQAYVYYGGPGADATADLTLPGEGAFDFFGRSVSGAGDVNGDGYPDVIVGADLNNAGGANAGRAYLYDCARYFVLSPNGGEIWNVGAMEPISWLGAEPADVWLSVDGGASYFELEAAVGGKTSNTISIRVPHRPSRFGRIMVRPADASVLGVDRSDSLFTIQTSVSLLSMLAELLPSGGASITWQTDPGPKELAGYRLERSSTEWADWKTLVPLTRETSYVDPNGGPGSRYRLFAVNGLGEERWLGDTAIQPMAALSAWPLPYRGGRLTISFATMGEPGEWNAHAEVAVFDVRGRFVRRVDSGVYSPGYRTATWDGRDSRGRDVATGVYFIRSKDEFGNERSMKVTVLR